ncbi:MAG: hypothetical protein JST29_01595 [Bacteroidetes bacterium]|nr:hypothetical protein [Bacteroidota bacterium]
MIITLNTKSDLISFLENKLSGTQRQYLISDEFKNKLNKIVYVANELNQKLKVNPIIEVKYSFGRREKRLEIVYNSKGIFHICKITNMTEFDKDAIELEMIIRDLTTKKLIAENLICGVLLFYGDYNIEIVSDFLTNSKMMISHFNALNIII